MLRGGRAGGAVLHLHQFVSERGEVAYIVNNSLSRVLITSEAKREIALAALRDCPKVELCLIVDGPGDGSRIRNLSEATAEFPATPIADESLGTAMLYSSGTTGRPEGRVAPAARSAARATPSAGRRPRKTVAIS